MTENPFAYFFSCVFVLFSHAAMLVNIFYNGNYDSIKDVIILAVAIAGTDIIYFVAMLFFKQHNFTADFMLLLILNMGVIFQSCFGGVHLSVKHLITCIACLISCRIGYILTRNHKWIQQQKKYIWLGIGILAVVILTLTGSRSMWIDLGFISIQPSEFMKPLFVLACATSVSEQQNKHKIWKFDIVWENIILFGITAGICLLQWWCRDLGSIPTFAAIYAVGFLLRICYPKAKFSNKTLLIAGAVVLAVMIVGIKFAPQYVRDRLFVDIWSDKSGNGYQQSQALIAIAEGGWFGKGPGKGFLYTVAAHESDIVFASISEEWGLLYAIMATLVLLAINTIPLINPPRSYYHATMCTGVCAALTVQMALNIFGSCNMIPFTGVTIPFIATGGSSMVASGLMVGMIVASQSPDFQKPKSKNSKNSKNKTNSPKGKKPSGTSNRRRLA